MSDLALQQSDTQTVVTPRPRVVEDRIHPVVTLRRALSAECEAMLHYALDRGKAIPLDITQQISVVLSGPISADDASSLSKLMVLHGQISAVIAPASGRTLVLFEVERSSHPRLYAFGPVRLVRQMLGFAVVALALTGALSTLPAVNVPNVATGWFELDGVSAYAVLAFLFSVAGLGAAFSNLSMINRYIENANYDPIFEGSYWVRIVLGLISGVVLGEIFSIW